MLNFEHFVAARSALCQRIAEARAHRLGKKIGGAEFDEMGVELDVDAPPAPPIAYHLIYKAASGELTGRCVTLQRIVHEVAEVRVQAVCHLRKKYREFLATRIVEITDLSTGEVDDDGLAYFRRHPLLRQATADHIAAMSDELLTIQDCRDEIIVLSFVAAADGLFDENEQDEIVKHVLYRADFPLNEAEIRRRVASWIPDERAFWHALGRLEAGEGDARALLTSLRRVIDADGDLDEEELAFAGEIERRLKAKAYA
ncbi:MAG TPA: TerB family tellurite resistance protein [Caulobacteraceae bacterium]|nr:TerB family tellurite resistance protein [Caulobacteraceae bacterium]